MRGETVRQWVYRYGFALAIALLGPVIALRPGHGQAVAPPTSMPVAVSPTAIPTSMPTGTALVELMRKAMVAHRTVRVGVTSLSTWPGHWVLGVTWMDLDLQSNALREVDTIHRLKPNAPRIAVSVWRRELVVAGGMGANRKPKSPWHCERLPGVRVRNSLIPFQMVAANVTTLGLEGSDGSAVWHVRAIKARVPAWSTDSAMVDLYISQSDNTLMRLYFNAITRIGKDRVHETVAETYRRYGKAVAITVPKQCR